MTFWGRFSLCIVAISSLLLGAGCMPSDSIQVDEERESHFVLGKSRVNAMDYEGAVQAFRESLEVNPRSSSAHFQLACLFDPKDSNLENSPVSALSDPAAAIYHYQEYLRLNPKAGNTDIVRQRIDSCKVKLAANVLQLPSTSAAQKQLEILVETNRILQVQIEQLNAAVKKWSEYAATLQAAHANGNTRPVLNLGQTDREGAPIPTPSLDASGGTRQPPPVRAAKPRTHLVASGETLSSIARKYGISLATLQAANPGVTPKKLKTGQSLNLPGQ